MKIFPQDKSFRAPRRPLEGMNLRQNHAKSQSSLQCLDQSCSLSQGVWLLLPEKDISLALSAIADGADGAAPIDVAEWREKRQKDGRTPAMEMLTELEDITRQLSNLRMETRLRRDDDLHSSSILPIQSTSLDST